jgi:hypothetical protein
VVRGNSGSSGMKVAHHVVLRWEVNLD